MILVDLERRCVVDLLRDRISGRLAARLRGQHGIRIMVRDQSTEYSPASPSGCRRTRGGALGPPWSDGQREGHITKLQRLKREMYSRTNFHLLRRRVLLAA